MTLDEFQANRPYVFGIAYRMLGSATEAEDILQEVFLRVQAQPDETIHSPKGFLSTVATRLCLDRLKSAQVAREDYIGPWLPEPLLVEPSPEGKAEEAESLSLAFLVLLETLSPLERAVFLLREVFEYDHAEIAAMLDKSEENCRQILRRARQRVRDQKKRFRASPTVRDAVIEAFLAATRTGDIDPLLEMLHDDAAWLSDGGGKVLAARVPIVGRDKVARFFQGIQKKRPPTWRTERVTVNGEPALAVWDGRRLYGVMLFEVTEDKVQTVLWIANPDKLAYLARQLERPAG